jgi:hypothetical protein
MKIKTIAALLFPMFGIILLNDFSAQADDSQHISNIGTIYTLDTSQPALGKSYRDPSGLIWGAPVTIQGETAKMTGHDGAQYCSSLGNGFHLPTLGDFKQLMTNLGYGPHSDYSPYAADGTTEMLPNLVESKYWTSTGYDGNAAFIFLGGNQGGIGFGYVYDDYAAVRCVFGQSSE